MENVMEPTFQIISKISDKPKDVDIIILDNNILTVDISNSWLENNITKAYIVLLVGRNGGDMTHTSDKVNGIGSKLSDAIFLWKVKNNYIQEDVIDPNDPEYWGAISEEEFDEHLKNCGSSNDDGGTTC